MENDLYIICSNAHPNYTVTRTQAESFLGCFYNRDAVQQALDSVRDMNDHINLSEGYVIRRAGEYQIKQWNKQQNWERFAHERNVLADQIRRP